jgi:hypothetical protein
MSREPMSTATQPVLPPARTRTATFGAVPERGLNLLAPVRSGLFGAAGTEAVTPSATEPVEPISEDTHVQSLVLTEIESGTVELDEETGEVEIVAEEITFELEGIADDDILLADDDAGGEEIVLEEAEEAEEAGTPDETESGMRQAPPPLSPWDLGAASMSVEAGERAARARVEWESLGQALSESLNAAGPPPEEPGPHGYELTDEKAAELDAEDQSPFGGHVMSVGSSGAAESPLDELVRRLEAFAASLRDEGPTALGRAQAGDDRFDALLASIAAGFLAGRGE